MSHTITKSSSKISETSKKPETHDFSSQSKNGRGSHPPPEEQVEKPSVKKWLKYPLSTLILDSEIPKSLEKPPKLNNYSKKGDSNEHVQHVGNRLNYYHTNKKAQCKLITLNLTESSMIWFKSLPNRSVDWWTNLFGTSSLVSLW